MEDMPSNEDFARSGCVKSTDVSNFEFLKFAIEYDMDINLDKIPDTYNLFVSDGVVVIMCDDFDPEALDYLYLSIREHRRRREPFPSIAFRNITGLNLYVSEIRDTATCALLLHRESIRPDQLATIASRFRSLQTEDHLTALRIAMREAVSDTPRPRLDEPEKFANIPSSEVKKLTKGPDSALASFVSTESYMCAFLEFYHDIFPTKRIGGGSFGGVYECEHKQEEQKLVCKISRFAKKGANDDLNEAKYHYLMSNLEIGISMPIPALYLLRVNCGEDTFVYGVILMRRATGTLSSYLEELRSSRLEPRSMLTSVEIELRRKTEKLIDSGLMCTDIKPDNILLEWDRDDLTRNPDVFITDFGSDYCKAHTLYPELQNPFARKVCVSMFLLVVSIMSDTKPVLFQEEIEWFLDVAAKNAALLYGFFESVCDQQGLKIPFLMAPLYYMGVGEDQFNKKPKYFVSVLLHHVCNSAIRANVGGKSRENVRVIRSRVWGFPSESPTAAGQLAVKKANRFLAFETKHGLEWKAV